MQLHLALSPLASLALLPGLRCRTYGRASMTFHIGSCQALPSRNHHQVLRPQCTGQWVVCSMTKLAPVLQCTTEQLLLQMLRKVLLEWMCGRVCMTARSTRTSMLQIVAGCHHNTVILVIIRPSHSSLKARSITPCLLTSNHIMHHSIALLIQVGKVTPGSDHSPMKLIQAGQLG